ncbi:MAG: membrane protein [Ignavibacteriales bacterium]
MSKQKKSSNLIKNKSARQSGFLAEFDLEKYFPTKYHLPVVLGIVVILLMMFLKPLFFGGMSFESGDIIAAESSQPYLQKDRDGFSLWNPHIFCGMPAYSLSIDFTWFNLIYVIFTVTRDFYTGLFSVEYVRWTFYLILLAVTMFMLVRHLTGNFLIGLFSSIATVFSTGIIVFLFIGHVTKLTSLAWYPLVFLMLLRFKEKITLRDFFILAVALQLLIQGFHLQIIFYLLLSIGIYFLYYLTLGSKTGEERVRLVKSGGALAAAVVIAFLIQADSFTQIYEYTPYSTRGGKSVVEESTGKAAQSESEYYDYHTNWSFSPGEVATFVVPSFYGFGYSTYSGPLSQNQEFAVNTYFGQMPFVDVAMYMGVLVFFLALFAAVTMWKDHLVKYLVILNFFALLLSFGSTFPLLFDLFFYYLPYFDKFRVPSMILVILQMHFPILAALGLKKIISLRSEKDAFAENVIKYAAYSFGALFLVSLLLNSVIASWFMERFVEGIPDKRYSVFKEYAAEMFTGDLYFSLFALTAMFFAALTFLKNRFSGSVVLLTVILLTTVDLLRIDARGARYTPAPDKSSMFDMPDYVRFIKEQKNETPFRIINIKQDGSIGSLNQNSNYHAYFLLEDFYGYSAIKPRAYQDLMDVVGPINPVLWMTGNVKYVIADQNVAMPGLTPIYNQNKTIIYQNDYFLERVFFTDSVAVKPAIEVLNMMKESPFDPRTVSFTDTPVEGIEKVDSTVYARITSYKDEEIIVEVNASGKNFLIFSSTYMPKGWKATIDGNELEILRANHAFMGVVVPKGKHTLVFTYLPDSWTLSMYLSLILSTVVVLGLVITVTLPFVKKEKKAA